MERLTGRCLLLVVALVPLALLAATPPPAGAKDTLVYATENKIDTLDHYKTSSGISWTIGYLMWDSLVEMDPKINKIIPAAAKSWRIIDDKTWEFTLNPGIKFHNGNPLNSEAVRFTLEEAILNPARKSTKAGHFKWVDKVQVVDDLTFRILTTEPYPLVLERLYNMFIYDPISTTAKGFEALAENPMGSGPYKMTKLDRGTELVMTRDPNYWKKDTAKINNIKIRIIPEPSIRLAELLSGGIDFTDGLPADMIDSLKKSNQVAPLVADTAEINFWQFDSAGRAGQSPLTDKRVRQAIWHAIDRQAIVKNVLKDLATVVDSPVNPLMFGYDPAIKGYGYDPEKAKALLKEAGYEKGFTVDLWQYVNHQVYPNQAAAGYLDKVGIKVNIKNYIGNVGQMVILRNTGKVTGIGNFEWITSLLDADVTLFSWFATETLDYSKDAQLAEWATAARSTLDRDKRREVYSKMQRRVVEEAYWMPFYSVKQLAGRNKKLHLDLVAGQIPWIKGAYWDN
jgi:peptide/nickel transport system substrate-binding protein